MTIQELLKSFFISSASFVVDGDNIEAEASLTYGDDEYCGTVFVWMEDGKPQFAIDEEDYKCSRADNENLPPMEEAKAAIEKILLERLEDAKSIKDCASIGIYDLFTRKA